MDAEAPELRTPARSFDRFWILDRDGEVAGCVGSTDTGGETVELEKLYVDGELRRSGWGRRLALLVEARARELGARRVELWSDTRFAEAHAFYLALGYEPTGASRELHDLSGTTELHFAKAL